MNNNYFMGYRVNHNIRHFFPNTVLFENENDKITVSMANDALNCILSIISTRFPPAESYKRAKLIFESMKKILANRQVGPMRKEDLKLAVDVLEEVKNLSAKSEEEKQSNAMYAGFCKLVIDRFGGNVSCS